MAKKKTLRPSAAAKPGRGGKAYVGTAWDESPAGDSPAAVFARKMCKMMKTIGLNPAALIAASGVGETTIYGILRAKLKSPPKAGTVQQLDSALKAGGSLVNCYASCIADAAKGSWL